MKIAFICLALVAVAFTSEVDYKDPFDYFMSPEVSLIETPKENIVAVAHHLQRLSQSHMAVHADTIAKHAEALVQTGAMVEDDDEIDDEKAKAYSHNFASSKKAITAALAALNNQLVAGHNHDKKALASAKTTGNNAITSVTNNASSKCKSYKSKACPTKRAEEAANTAKVNAKKAVEAVKAGKICPLSTTWGDMDVEKSVPKLGTELRNKWDATRAKYRKAKTAYDNAVKAHQAATNKYQAAMTAFKTALSVEASAVNAACLNAHKEHNALKSEVAANVASRKQVWIATLVVECYINNLTSNSAAKACADKKRSENTSRWNISAPSLNACKSKGALTATFGPATWAPTASNCQSHLREMHCPAGPSTSVSGFNPAVSGYKAVACGDCDSGYTPFSTKSLAKCAAECKKIGCKRFSYGVKRHDGKSALGCRVSKNGGKCPNSTTRYCAKSYTPSWTGAEGKHCCHGTTCGKINHWGGVIFEPKH